MGERDWTLADSVVADEAACLIHLIQKRFLRRQHATNPESSMSFICLKRCRSCHFRFDNLVLVC